jgi:hypothetical protein
MLPKDWPAFTQEYTFQNSDWFAVIRADDATIANEPVLVRSDGECFVKQYGLLVPAESVPGFLKFEERPWRKRLLDTATLETIEIPLFSK